MTSTLTRNQKKKFTKTWTEDGKAHSLTATVDYDDECGNGHNTFSITGDLKVDGRWDSGGCLHELIAEKIPELAPYIKWHLCDSNGPMHYLANTLYHAGDRDCWGLREGEVRQLKNGKTGKLSWKLEATAELPDYVDADEQPHGTAVLRYVPWNRVGEGKPRDLDAARSCAVWPDATDEELMADNLRERLMERLPGLMVEFRAAVESLGFVW